MLFVDSDDEVYKAVAPILRLPVVMLVRQDQSSDD